VRNAYPIIVLTTLITILSTVYLKSATGQNKPIYKPTGEEASLVGTISFAGVPPEPRQIDMSADPICETVNPESATLPTEDVIVTDGKLANVFIYVRAADPLDAYSFDAPSTEVTLEHKGCRYVPHMLGLQTEQTLKILNSDPTTHNTHPTPKNNREWNQSQMPGAVIEQRFASPELFIPIRDNQHPWERAYVGVFSHPFFAVSNKDGGYRIAGLPPGQYTIVAWHEKYGEQKIDISVGSREQRTLDFTFNPAAN